MPCAVWALAGTGVAVSEYRTIARLTEEAATRQAEHESKVRALTRRLVGVASHQMLEQDGLAERLADIITRQVELENRESALAAMVERALASGAPPPGGSGGGTGELPPPQPMRKGASAEPAFAGRTTREQFERIEAGIGRVEARQVRLTERISAVAQAHIERVRSIITDLQLALAPAPATAPRTLSSRNVFAHALASAEAALAEAGRWRGLAETIPLRTPIDGEASRSSNFGPRKDPFTGERRMHAGMDFRSPSGTLVRAAAGGRVVTANQSGGYGTLVEVDHGHAMLTRYAHLLSTRVEVGQLIQAGTIVGLVGSTGRSTGPHLHYETRIAGNPVDPGRFLAAGQKLLDAQVPATIAPEPDLMEAAD